MFKLTPIIPPIIPHITLTKIVIIELILIENPAKHILEHKYSNNTQNIQKIKKSFPLTLNFISTT